MTVCRLALMSSRVRALFKSFPSVDDILQCEAYSKNTTLLHIYVRESCHKLCRVIRMATASRLDCLGVFPNDGDIRLQSQAAMLVITLGMVCAGVDR
jgi:hypothetical protein